MDVAVLLDARVDEADADDVVHGELDVAAVLVAFRALADVRILARDQVVDRVPLRAVEVDEPGAAVAQRLDLPAMLATAELGLRP
jgi:hypothetical protein